MRYLTLILSLITAFSLVGCDSADRERVEEAGESLKRAGETAKRAGESLKRVAADVVLPPEREEQLGDRMAQQTKADATVLEDAPVADYVRKLGAQVVAEADDRPEAIDFDFHVIEDSAINAFAIPGGHIFVTTGLLEAAESEAELVAVLGHEVAHVTRRHIAERMTAAYGISTLMNIALGQESGALEQMVAQMLAQGFLLKHSRDNEREADETGMRYIIDAGYSPKGYVAFFERIAEQPQPPALLSSHPNPEERVERARQAISNLDESVVNRPVHRERYQKATSSL